MTTEALITAMADKIKIAIANGDNRKAYLIAKNITTILTKLKQRSEK